MEDETVKAIITFLNIVGYISSILVLAGIVVGFILWSRGILPAMIRLGNGLSKRKIALFAKSDHFTSLKDLLLDSTLFNEKNIFAITQEDDIGKAEQASIYLVYWDDWGSAYQKILNKKTDSCALIIYARPASIPHDIMEEIELHRNTIVNNFRGRLLNDVVSTMITTAYKRK